jgi:methionine synthase I (cobalamin-dependent)
MHTLIQNLVASGPDITDGAWGTQLQLRGLPQGVCPDQWNVSHPEVVEVVPRAYVAAGSQVILTNTFRSNRVTLADYGLGEQAAALSRAGAQISRRAAGDGVRVFGSIGPSGKMLFGGEVDAGVLAAAFAEQARALAEGGADALVVETMSDLEEAKLALAAARPLGLPVVVSMVFDTGTAQDRTMTGATPEQVATELTAAGADVVGANCGQGIAGYVEICRRLRAATDRPLWIKANAGLPQMIGNQVVYQTTAAEFGNYGPALVAAGADFLGGCCGTGPEYIRALIDRIGRRRSGNDNTAAADRPPSKP